MDRRRSGVAVFPGMGVPIEHLTHYLEAAAGLGYRELFTSLHLPETDIRATAAELRAFAPLARHLGFGLTADISHRTLDALGASTRDVAPLAKLGLTAVRADYGFSAEELAALLAHRAELRVVLNAGRLSADLVTDLRARGADLAGQAACHNYYPRPETGVSLAFVAERGRELRCLGLEVWAFVPSQHARRGPVFEGLPTVEEHRRADPARAAEELFASGGVDVVLFGDPLASAAELEGLAAVAARDHVRIRVSPAPSLSAVEASALEADQEVWDLAPRLVRANNDTIYHPDRQVLPARTWERPAYTVTLDNVSYGRFAGGLNISLVDLPADPRVNVVATILPEDRVLVDCLRVGDRFRLEQVPSLSGLKG